MKNKFYPLLYGLGVFVVFAILVVVLRLITGKVPDNTIIFNMYTKDDLLLGLAVAALLTFSHIRKRNIRK